MSRWLLLAFVPGCIFVIKDPPCTDLAAVSVTVIVEDDLGVVVPDATVTWREGAGPAEACQSWGPEDGEFACAFEVAGDLTIRVEAAGYAPFEQTVTVRADECHVIGRTITAVLSPPDCTDEVVPSVEVTVVGASGEALEEVAVTWRRGEEGPEAPCDLVGPTWWCAEEVAGELTVTALAAGHTTVSETVTVTEDECHVLTEARTLTLDWLPD